MVCVCLHTGCSTQSQRGLQLTQASLSPPICTPTHPPTFPHTYTPPPPPPIPPSKQPERPTLEDDGGLRPMVHVDHGVHSAHQPAQRPARWRLRGIHHARDQGGGGILRGAMQGWGQHGARCSEPTLTLCGAAEAGAGCTPAGNFSCRRTGDVR
jgi:hypothetical protein